MSQSTDTLDEILIDESAQASEDRCSYCDDSENWPSGPKPLKCHQCLEDERVAIERMAEK